jgi:hypothetical protein
MDANVLVQFNVRAGYTLIAPLTVPPVDLADPQLHLDLPSFCLTTNRLPLPRFGWPDLPELRLDQLARALTSRCLDRQLVMENSLRPGDIKICSGDNAKPASIMPESPTSLGTSK